MRKKLFLRILKYVKYQLFTYLLTLIGLVIIQTLNEILKITIIKNMFDAIAEKNISLFLNTLLIVVIFLILLAVMTPFLKYLFLLTSTRITGKLKKQVFEHLSFLATSYFDNTHSGVLMSKLTNDISTLEQAYKIRLLAFLTSTMIGSFSIVYLLILDWRLCLFSTISGLIIVFINLKYINSIYKVSAKYQEKISILTEKFVDFLSGIPIIKSFNLYTPIQQKYHIYNQQVYEQSLKRVHYYALLNMWGLLLGLAIFKIAFGSYLVIKGLITVGTIVAFLQLHNNVDIFFRGISSFLTFMQESLAAAERVFEILEQPSEFELAESKILVTDSIIEFDNVSFGYTKEDMVLQNMSFKVHKGEAVAFVGSSGVGKSTIAKTIMGFYLPVQGKIIVAGKVVNKSNILNIREKISFVSQDAHLFSGSVLENIGWGKISASTEEIIKAAKIAHAHEFIMDLADGYNTQVGERGVNLSGGQRQRIAIARALIKDAPILILDEATSALDMESECLIQHALKDLMQRRTTLIIAHRLSTVKSVDRILFVCDGQIVEEGSHYGLLMNENGFYRNLFLQQFA